MKPLFCSQYHDVECCVTCHHDDSFFKTTYKNFYVTHCCTSIYDIQKDIDKHSDEPLEDDCQ